MTTAQGCTVVKIGGSTLGNHDTTLEDLVTLQRQGRQVVVVHGGGKTISEWMERQGLYPSFVRGLRVTDAPSLEVVTAVLAGLLNKDLVASLIALGGRAVGLSGADGGMLQARIQDPELGLVGEVTRVEAGPLEVLLRANYLPVVAPLALHHGDGSAPASALLNINGDTAAGELAVTLRAQSLVFLTDVEGVLDGSQRLIRRLTRRQARDLIASGIAAGGMIPKLEACVRALGTVEETCIVDGRRPHALLETVDGKEIGTRIN